ncbi:CHAP domain-containing protein [Spirosoma luteum]|uniref:CHAP domain-containing protein n=1 Tax=Spirosoma luteum TaxID=431553 RepID=UPI0003731661|nr:CHAP domain-containing protein [Spirosoma luteum]
MTPTVKTLPTLQQVAGRLTALGWAVNPAVPNYALRDTLKRFQSACGIVPDGEFGPVTNGYLFLNQRPNGTATEILLRVAASQIGISEVPPGSNRGPQIDLVLKGVGLTPGYAWCSAFSYWVFAQMSRMTQTHNPHPKTAGVLNLWDLAGFDEVDLKRITAAEVAKKPELVKPGMQFLMKFSSTAGHTGIVEKVEVRGGRRMLVTVEGNSNRAGEREGVAVLKQTKRPLSSINLGFIDYFG